MSILLGNKHQFFELNFLGLGTLGALKDLFILKAVLALVSDCYLIILKTDLLTSSLNFIFNQYI